MTLKLVENERPKLPHEVNDETNYKKLPITIFLAFIACCVAIYVIAG